MKTTLIITTILFFSLNANSQWTETNGPYGATVYCLAHGSYLFAGTSTGIYRSANNGTNWSFLNKDLPEAGVYAIAISGQNILAGFYGKGIYFSADTGNSWTEENNGLISQNVFSLGIDGTNVFAGTGDGLFSSTSIGGTWSRVTNGFPGIQVNAIVNTGNQLFAGTYGGGDNHEFRSNWY